MNVLKCKDHLGTTQTWVVVKYIESVRKEQTFLSSATHWTVTLFPAGGEGSYTYWFGESEQLADEKVQQVLEALGEESADEWLRES